jgi:CheY-like chemotaxis protein
MQIQSQAFMRWQLPLEDQLQGESAIATSNFRILIVNEDMRSADSLKRTLHDLGYFTTLTAYSAGRALQAVEEFAPAVALLDLDLPDMTGYQLAHKLRTHLSTCVRQVPLLAVAELLQLSTGERTRAAGFVGWLAKPVQPDALNALLARVQAGPLS